MKNRIVPVDKDLNSTFKLNPIFPFVLSRDDLSDYVGGFVNWHKQTAIEIAIVVEGRINVTVLEREETMEVGDGFLILPERLHTLKPSKGSKVARYFTFIFEPVLLTGFKGSFFEHAFYFPALSKKEAFYKFNIQDNWTHPIFEQMKWVYEQEATDRPSFQLNVQRIVQDVWIILWNNLLSKEEEGDRKQHNTRILIMIEYLHNHYSSKFSLSDMAAQSNVSRGECCRYFKKMMHMTISDYLMEYRVSKAIELLESADRSISEISETVGFSSQSYFIESFKKKTRLTPLAYRKLLKGIPK
ncbi:helix-turn-helix domain-containing protein [Paenibacillus glycanilyticus]|uniref:HTH-type transcriptional regulator YdeC n=1 Tax=Paenibacillus glycanilyticus TaxID=126569 RepID=A0ABQ6GME7_9BACL|nr:AraC family transcriptional regulator [Paenibacillus glycanilyticus]GLX70806.1 putative HTH-type transcriptional regulator YdeC [Paenibacillus glycanilyticus]